MRNFQWVLWMAAAGALSVSGQAIGNQFLGNWENVDSATEGLARLSVTETPNGLRGRAFGKCQPADCDWGAAPLNLLGFSAEDRNPSWVMASWEFGSSVMHLVAHLEGREMLAESYIIFRDNSRPNYRSTYRLKQQRGLTDQAVPIPSGRPPDASGVYRVGREVSAPVVTYREEPRYTDAAAKAKIDGAVLISLIVGENGVPRDLRIVRSLEPGLDQNALKAVSNWRFRPGEKGGKPVAVQSTIEISFHILKAPR